MPIEFRCSACEKLLRVKDDSAGKKAKCPECGTVLEIPAASNPAAAPPPMPASTGEENPFASPTAPDTGMTASKPVGGVTPTRIDTGDVLSHAWRIFKTEMGTVIGAVLIAGLINGAGSGLQSFLQAQDAGLAAFAVSLLMIVVNTFMQIGVSFVLLDVARGKGGSLDKLFSGGPFLVTAIVATILYLIAVTIGLFLLIIPGIIVAIMFSQYFLLIVDKNAGIMDSLMLSRAVTNGNKLTLFVIYLACVGIAFLGILACIVGLFVAAPYITLIYVVAYMKMTGQGHELADV